MSSSFLYHVSFAHRSSDMHYMWPAHFHFQFFGVGASTHYVADIAEEKLLLVPVTTAERIQSSLSFPMPYAVSQRRKSRKKTLRTGMNHNTVCWGYSVFLDFLLLLFKDLLSYMFWIIRILMIVADPAPHILNSISVFKTVPYVYFEQRMISLCGS